MPPCSHFKSHRSDAKSARALPQDSGCQSPRSSDRPACTYALGAAAPARRAPRARLRAQQPPAPPMLGGRGRGRGRALSGSRGSRAPGGARRGRGDSRLAAAAGSGRGATERKRGPRRAHRRSGRQRQGSESEVALGSLYLAPDSEPWAPAAPLGDRLEPRAPRAPRAPQPPGASERRRQRNGRGPAGARSPPGPPRPPRGFLLLFLQRKPQLFSCPNLIGLNATIERSAAGLTQPCCLKKKKNYYINARAPCYQNKQLRGELLGDTVSTSLAPAATNYELWRAVTRYLLYFSKTFFSGPETWGSEAFQILFFPV